MRKEIRSFIGLLLSVMMVFNTVNVPVFAGVLDGETDCTCAIGTAEPGEYIETDEWFESKCTNGHLRYSICGRCSGVVSKNGMPDGNYSHSLGTAISDDNIATHKRACTVVKCSHEVREAHSFGGDNVCDDCGYVKAAADPDPTATPTATATPTVTPTVTPSVTPTVTPSVTPTVTPSVTPSVTPTVTPSVTPTTTPTPCPDSEHKNKNNYKYTSVSSKKHKIECIKCGTVIKTEASCSFVVDKEDYDDPDDFDPKYHTQSCKYCSNSREVKHSFSYEYDENDKHIKKCACRYKDTVSCDYSDNVCVDCGHSRGSSSSSGSSSGTPYTAPTDIESLRKVGKALARNTINLKINGASYDVAAVEAEQRDMINQYLIGNIMLTQLGYNVLTPTKTYKFSSYNYLALANQPQTITWTNTGMKAGDVAYVVYWHPVKKTQLLPCIVGMDGSATFIVPDINGAICTLIKCETIAPQVAKKGKK